MYCNTSRPTALKPADASSVVFVEHTKTCYSSFVRPPPPPRPPPSDTYTQTTHQVVSSPVILGQVCLPWVQGVKLTQSSDVIENVWLCVFDLNKKQKKNIYIYLFSLSQWLVWSWTSAPGWPDSSTPPRGWMWVYPVPHVSVFEEDRDTLSHSLLCCVSSAMMRSVDVREMMR